MEGAGDLVEVGGTVTLMVIPMLVDMDMEGVSEEDMGLLEEDNVVGKGMPMEVEVVWEEEDKVAGEKDFNNIYRVLLVFTRVYYKIN